MYKAVGENSWRDGVFSHAAPRQSYQASLNQFADGSLGAYARKVQQNGALRDGSLGRTFLPSLRGAFRDGSLGDDGSATVTLPNGQQVSVTSTPQTTVVPWYKTPLGLVVAAVAGGGVVYFLLKK